MTETFLQSTCLRCGEGKPLQLSPGWHFYCLCFFFSVCLFYDLPIASKGYTWAGSSNSGKNRDKKKVEKKIAGSYVTASWELAGVQESCSINLRKLGQSCMWLSRVCSAPCWQRENNQPPGVSWLHPCLQAWRVYREAGGVIWGRLAESVWQRM